MLRSTSGIRSGVRHTMSGHPTDNAAACGHWVQAVAASSLRHEGASPLGCGSVCWEVILSHRTNILSLHNFLRIFDDLYKTVSYCTGFPVNFYLPLLKFLWTHIYSCGVDECKELWTYHDNSHTEQIRHLRKSPCTVLGWCYIWFCPQPTLSRSALLYLARNISCLV